MSRVPFMPWLSPPGTIAGLRVVESPLLTKRIMFRHCRTHSRRIVKKWAKNPKNWREVPDLETVYRTPTSIICHPALAAKLRRQLGR